MKKKILLSLFIIASGVLVFGKTTDNFEYKTDKRGMVITAYKGSDTRIIIPEKINGKPVAAIGYQAFAFDNLESVSIPDSVKYIDGGAFFSNQLKEINLPASLVSIGDIAFSHNKISTIAIPDSVTTIGSNAFSGNQLTSISLPAKVTMGYESFYAPVFDEYYQNDRKKSIFSIVIVLYNKYKIAIIDNSAAEILAYCGNEEQLVLPGEINGIPVVDIGDGAFSSCFLTSVVIPNSVERIGDNAFPDNELTEVVIPDSVRFIGNGAFFHNKISNITLSDHLVSIGNAAFTSNKLTDVTLPESLVSIGFAAFSSNDLGNVTIPNFVRSIGEMAFDRTVRVKSPHFSVSPGASQNSYSYH
ncbi:MAG: leucine-rich repeat domain-containing protein [Treponema sp.]|nr:leucine-rich repeat domain-containing protein [Treponema sp.]